MTRPAASARTLRDTGVVFVPIAGDVARTVAAWRTPRRVAERLVDRLARLAAQVDLTAAG